VVLVHQFRGSSAQWRPLVERLAAPPRHCSVLAFDLRGHGASTLDAKGKHADWSVLSSKDVPGLVWDIHAAIDHGLVESGGRASSVILVGASLSAALAAQVAREQPKVVAVALVSPGDMLEGYDVFHRYHAIRDLPAFVAAAEGDTVASEPAKLIGRLGGERVTLKLYPGSGHGPQGITRTDDRLWQDLFDWIERVKSEKPTGRPVVARGSPPDFKLPTDIAPRR
jgi:pimeloyl-ACP methyl ester carboxylesterase